MDKKFNSLSYFEDFSVSRQTEIRIKQVLSMIGTGKRVLDLGCGDGFFMERIKSKGNEVTGIEVSNSAIEKARSKGLKIYDILLEGNWSAEIDDKFDVVFAGEIIEHIFDTDNFLKNVSRVLKDSGFLIITTPNMASMGRRLLLLFGKNPLIETTARKKDAGHIRYFTQGSLEKLLSENGFKIVDTKSSVINFTNGTLFSERLAQILPSFGNNIIVKAYKSNLKE